MMVIRFVFTIFYLFGYNGHSCPTGCASCNSYTDPCERCFAGYWLVKNDYCYPCPDGCAECSSSSYCTKCKPNHWNTYTTCHSKCYGNCDENGCDDSTGFCHECKSGYFGIKCITSCELCNNQSCGPRRCTDGCIDGYYEYSSGDEILCRQCRKNCAVCVGLNYCLTCKTGFYVHNYIRNGKYCYPCQQNCEKCTDKNRCIICKPGTYGTSCERNCSIANCHRCTGSNDIKTCMECENGYRFDGNECVPCESSNGLCLEECTSGYWGENCKKTCPGVCTRCNKTNGYCDVCHRNKYGKYCQFTCSEHCADDGNILQVCSLTYGKCELGCKHGYGGDRCHISASTGSSAGTLSTTVKESDSADDLAKSSQQQMGLFIGIGAGAVALIIAVVVVLIVCVIRKKTRQRKDDTDVSEVGNEHLQNDIGQDYIYTQANKQKKAIHHKQEDISGPQHTLNVAYTEDDKYKEIAEDETDIDTILLENIDDEPKSIIVTEVNIPESDTYYNMVGLKRSRIHPSRLFEYMKDKSDFENEFMKLPQGLTRTCNEALKPQNRAKNRYNGIYAYDATRVVLQSKSYINANYIDCHSQSAISYIASLGPTKSTMNNFSTFWEMVWQEKSNKIVMLTNLEESKKMKCQQYWPNQGCLAKYGRFTISCTSEKLFSDFVVRKFNVEQHAEKRQVTHYHYTAWPDKTVPHTVASLLEFRDKVEQSECQAQGPMIVHCSAGIGRTGTYIALDILIREGKKEDSVDIFGCVIALRGQRVSLVQNVEQYIFLHHCVLYALTCKSGTLPISTVPQFMTDEKIATQYESFQKVTLLTIKEREKRQKIQSNRRKENRKGAEIPDDDHRLQLTLAEHDYINAVYVNGYEEVNKFIIAQTPLPNTVEDFISLLYQERCSYIVCLDEENIVDKTVAKYIPKANEVLTFGHFQATCTNSDSREDFVIRDLKISRIGTPPAKELMIRHCQFRGWKGSDLVPATIPFLNLISYVETARKSHYPKQPIAVHCLTGSERGGLFSVVSVLLEKMVSEQNISVLNTISQIRSRRRTAIPDIEQLRFCYNCVEEIKMSDTSTYYNIGCV